MVERDPARLKATLRGLADGLSGFGRVVARGAPRFGGHEAEAQPPPAHRRCERESGGTQAWGCGEVGVARSGTWCLVGTQVQGCWLGARA